MQVDPNLKMTSVKSELEQSFGTDPNVKQTNKKLSTGGKVLIALSGGAAVGLSIICIPFVLPAFRKYCLPYVPATNKQLSNVLTLVRANSNEKLLDIGSGDGRIVIAAAKNGVLADGVELNTWLVQYSRLSAIYHGVYNRVRFYQRDLWKFDVSPYQYIVIFGVEQMMTDLEKKLVCEANKDAKVIACRFPLPNLQPVRVIGDGIDTVWLYTLKKQ